MDNKQQSNINYNNNTTTSEHYTNISNRPEFLSAAFTSTENLQPTSLQAQRYINHNYNNNHESGIDASSLAQTELLRGIRSEHSYGPSSALGGFDYSSLQPASLAQYSTYSKQNDMSLNPKQAYNNYSRSDKLELQATVLPELSKNESVENNIPPCAPGGFIDPNCHFFVSEDPLSTLQSLVSLLRDSNVDCQLSSEEYKIRCQAYKDHSRVEFVVRIFSSSTPNNNINRSYAIEFQRRFGDGVFFHRIFRDAKATLLGLKHESRSNTPELQNHSITQTTTTETTKTETSNNEPMECLPCPSLCKIMLANLDKPCIIECVSKSIRCLVSMCETECVDIKSQGLIALAAMSDRVDFHNYLHKYGALELFLESIYCNYEDIHRCCCTGLANLTENNRDLCQQIMENTKLKERLCNLSHSTCPEVVRQVAKIVKNLSTLEPILLAKDKDLREVVEYLAVSSDEQARAAAVAVLDTIPV